MEKELQELVNETEKEQSELGTELSVDTHVALTHPYSLSTLAGTSFQKNKLLFKYDITFKGLGVRGHRSLLSVEFPRHGYFQKGPRRSRFLIWLFSISCFASVISQFLYHFIAVWHALRNVNKPHVDNSMNSQLLHIPECSHPDWQHISHVQCFPPGPHLLTHYPHYLDFWHHRFILPVSNFM